MSVYRGTLGNLFSKTCKQYLSISQKATVSNPPVDSSPRLKPPIPEKRSKCLSFILSRSKNFKLILTHRAFQIKHQKDFKLI